MTAHNDDVMFIHVPKCAGWTVKSWLRDVLPGFTLPGNAHGHLPAGHTALRDMEQWTGRKPESYRKIIGVIRNPYEREASEWIYRRDGFAKGERNGMYVAAAAHSTLTSFMQDPLSEWHRLDTEAPGHRRHTKYPDNKTYETYGGFWMYWLAVDGTIPPNVQILRQENLATELAAAVGEFTSGDLPELPRLNATNHDEAMKYHTPLSVRLTEQRCEWAFDNFYERLSEKE